MGMAARFCIPLIWFETNMHGSASIVLYYEKKCWLSGLSITINLHTFLCLEIFILIFVSLS